MTNYHYLPNEDGDEFDPPADGSVTVVDDPTIDMDEDATAIVAKYGLETMRFINRLYVAMVVAGYPLRQPMVAEVDDSAASYDVRRQRARYPKSVMD